MQKKSDLVYVRCWNAIEVIGEKAQKSRAIRAIGRVRLGAHRPIFLYCLLKFFTQPGIDARRVAAQRPRERTTDAVRALRPARRRRLIADGPGLTCRWLVALLSKRHIGF